MSKVDIVMPSEEEVMLFLLQSNFIEGVYGNKPLEDAKKAWDYAIKKDTLSIEDVLKIHKILINRIEPRIAGKIRECDVWIGGEHKKFISKKILRDRVRSVLEKMNASLYEKVSTGVRNDFPKRCHIGFEDIHPFEDGNGRVGRIIYNWHRIKMGMDIHIIHEGKEQKEYYTWFKDKSLWV